MKRIFLFIVGISFISSSCKTGSESNAVLTANATNKYSCPIGTKTVHSCVGVTTPNPGQLEKQYALVCQAGNTISLGLVVPTMGNDNQPEFNTAEVVRVGGRLRYSAKFYNQAFETQLIIKSTLNQGAYSASLVLADNTKAWPMHCTTK